MAADAFRQVPPRGQRARPPSRLCLRPGRRRYSAALPCLTASERVPPTQPPIGPNAERRRVLPEQARGPVRCARPSQHAELPPKPIKPFFFLGAASASFFAFRSATYASSPVGAPPSPSAFSSSGMVSAATGDPYAVQEPLLPWTRCRWRSRPVQTQGAIWLLWGTGRYMIPNTPGRVFEPLEALCLAGAQQVWQTRSPSLFLLRPELNRVHTQSSRR